jgi:hypothetical protein
LPVPIGMTPSVISVVVATCWRKMPLAHFVDRAVAADGEYSPPSMARATSSTACPGCRHDEVEGEAVPLQHGSISWRWASPGPGRRWVGDDEPAVIHRR